MKIVIFLKCIILCTHVYATNFYSEVSIDPLFTILEEQTDPAKNSLNFYGSTYGARLGAKTFEEKLGLEAHYFNANITYEYDAIQVKTDLALYGVGAYYFLNEAFRMGLAFDRFDQGKTTVGPGLDGYLISFAATHSYSIYREYYLNLSVLYSLLSFGESESSQSLKMRSVLVGIGRTF